MYDWALFLTLSLASAVRSYSGCDLLGTNLVFWVCITPDWLLTWQGSPTALSQFAICTAGPNAEVEAIWSAVYYFPRPGDGVLEWHNPCTVGLKIT